MWRFSWADAVTAWEVKGNTGMSFKSQEALLRSEETYKEEVYRAFDHMRLFARDAAEAKKSYVASGAFEDQDSFMAYSDLAGANKSRSETEKLIQKLYKRPYFAHVEVREESETNSEHYYLSDCESLDGMVNIGTDSYLLPFKQDKERPVSIALFHCYQSQKGKPVRYTSHGVDYVLLPKLICNDTINNRHLLDAVQLFPESGIFQITADELLEEKLQENRNNPTLRNIIATLQRMQFEIIEADTDKSFVVQGCAGSGKSQCLLHRLFFLRDTLSQEGWDHVLLLTPTQLFRNYSAELIRRYQLSEVENCSIADLYRRLLNVYDARFKNRQYQYELSEEYLPDAYLREVYDPGVIERIDDEIGKAIRRYVEAGCAALGSQMPERITAVLVGELVKQLDEEIREFDSRESVLQRDEVYAEKRSQYEQLQKKLDTLQKRREKLLENYEQIIKEGKQLEELCLALQEAQAERAEWIRQRDLNQRDAIRKLTGLADRWNTEDDIQMPARYAQQLFLVEDILFGERSKADEEYARFLDEYCAQADTELRELIKSQTPEKAAVRQEKRKREILERAEYLASEIQVLSEKAEEYAHWLRNGAEGSEGEASKRTLRRSEMERARYFLSRIESAVFEREVWNTLTPLKEKYHIQTLQVESLQGGHQRETRILYKSDLLFYLKIYAFLYPDAVLPDYRMICIDEGQDLHKADYDMLHRLYPRAVFNVFGDTDQVLHTACGIQDWERETGIKKQYLMNRNYRNTAAIVDFCNRSFGSCMEYIGKVKKDQKPHRVTDFSQLKAATMEPDMVLIVKDRRTLEQMCGQMGKPVSDFEYLDTRAEKKQSGKIPCYSIFAAKGLEFSNVLVCASGMTTNQKVVACTRAMEDLYYYE